MAIAHSVQALFRLREWYNHVSFPLSATSAEDKKRIWDEYARLDPDYRTGDLVLDINAPEAAQNTYTVQSGDSLSKIGAKYGVSWQKIFEANSDKLSDPDKIHPGQELTIPSE